MILYNCFDSYRIQRRVVLFNDNTVCLQPFIHKFIIKYKYNFIAKKKKKLFGKFHFVFESSIGIGFSSLSFHAMMNSIECVYK